MKTLSRLSSAVLTVPLALGMIFGGVAPAAADTGIGNEHRALPDARYWLGSPTSEEICGLRDHGCYRLYEKGAIHWSPATGARAQRGAILARWRDEGSEHGPLGYPVTRERCHHGRCEVRYQRGRITWSPRGGTTVERDVDDPGSTTVVVNKKRPLSPRTHTPDPLRAVAPGVQLRDDAAVAYRRMARAAEKQGVQLHAVSGYRGHGEQARLYHQYTGLYGRPTADAISARPGHSEHQTGLALDIGSPAGTCALQACFADTPQGKWVVAHAHEHGFVIRYPRGRTATTGYAYEPWHLRYVGAETARSVADSGAPDLESYLGLPSAPQY